MSYPVSYPNEGNPMNEYGPRECPYCHVHYHYRGFNKHVDWCLNDFIDRAVKALNAREALATKFKFA